jgi:hypothetical protein
MGRRPARCYRVSKGKSYPKSRYNRGTAFLAKTMRILFPYQSKKKKIYSHNIKIKIIIRENS